MITAPNSLLNILIVEDNFSFATELRMLIRNLGYNCAGVIETGEKALLEIQKNTPDAIIMDITLSGELSGLDVAEKIKNEKIPILIITSFNDEMTYLRASKLDMIGFLVKPLNEYTLRSAIDACLKTIDTTDSNEVTLINQALVVKKGHLYHKIKAEDIYFVESDKTYLTFHTCKEKFVRKGSLKKIMEMLDEFTFVRSHKSFLINLKHLKGIDTNNNIAIMNNNITIPISRRNKKTIETFWLEANRKKVV